MPAPVHLPFDDLLPAITERESSLPDAYPGQTVSALLERGVHAGAIPKPLGGHGWGLPDSVEAIRRLAEASPSAALLFAMPLGLGSAATVSPETAPEGHRAAFLADGERIAADFRSGKIYAACNSEKGAGGSLAATKTVATRGEGGSFSITGEKILASFGTNADVFFSTARVDPADVPGAGIVEFFFLDAHGPGVDIQHDWDGFGMRSTESHTVRLEQAPSTGMLGFPNFIELRAPSNYWGCLFAAIPLGCASAILREMGTPAPASPALRLRFSEALMRYESLAAYLRETASSWVPDATPAQNARTLRTKTYVSQEATALCASLFALGGGRHYRQGSRIARLMKDAFAGTALRPPLPNALDALVEQFALEEDLA
jgi:isovaleryl-CoA dehydrogenase